MDNKKLEYKCPQCNEQDYSVEHQGGSTTSFLLCHNCGFSGTPKAWSKQQEDLSQPMMMPAYAQSVADNINKASDKPKPENDVYVPISRDKEKKYRTKPEKRLMHDDEENIRNPGRMSMNNPFVKESQTNRYSLIKELESMYVKLLGDGNEFYEVRKDLRTLSNEGLAHYYSVAKKQLDRVMEEDKNFENNDGYFAKTNPFVKESQFDMFKRKKIINYVREAIDYYTPDPTERENLYQMINDEIPNIIDRVKSMDQDPEIVRHNSRAITTDLIKQMLSNQGQNEYGSTMMAKTNPFIKAEVKKARGNPFVREAREHERSEWAQMMKEKSKNMVFPEGNHNKNKDSKPNENPDLNGKKQSDPLETKYYDFDTVDRKEYRSSPNPRDIIPGHAEWEDAQVDKFYDGWVEDHIVNSGGKLVGSNTEKTMNLDKGQHSIPPVYPTEAGYEKLLESRHQFDDDYTRVVADNHTYIFTKAAIQHIKATKKPSEDKLRTTEQRLTDPDNKEHIHDEMDNENQEKRTSVHSSADFNYVEAYNKGFITKQTLDEYQKRKADCGCGCKKKVQNQLTLHTIPI